MLTLFTTSGFIGLASVDPMLRMERMVVGDERRVWLIAERRHREDWKRNVMVDLYFVDWPAYRRKVKLTLRVARICH